jgi:hypothetical protein
MIVVFFESKWNNWTFFPKCALLLLWWPILIAKLRTAKPKTFWRIRSVWDMEVTLRELPTDDPRMLRIDKKLRAKREKKDRIKQEMERRARILATASAPTFHHLMGEQGKLDVTKPEGQDEPQSQESPSDPATGQ